MTRPLCRAHRWLLRGALTGGGALLSPIAAHAQGSSATTLPARLAPDTRAAIERLADSVRAVGLPAGPLVDKAAEGVLKGADDRRILAAVQSLARELGDARIVLGSAADVPLLVATSSAIHAGVQAADLRRLLRQASSNAGTPALVSALVTLVDLVAKHVPPALAAAALTELASRGAAESQFLALRAGVEQDVRDGRAPEASIAARTRAQVRLLDDPAGVKPIRP